MPPTVESSKKKNKKHRGQK